MKTHLSQIRFTGLLVFISITSCSSQPQSKPEINNATAVTAHVTLQLINNQIQSPVALGVPGDGDVINRVPVAIVNLVGRPACRKARNQTQLISLQFHAQKCFDQEPVHPAR